MDILTTKEFIGVTPLNARVSMFLKQTADTAWIVYSNPEVVLSRYQSENDAVKYITGILNAFEDKRNVNPVAVAPMPQEKIDEPVYRDGDVALRGGGGVSDDVPV